MSREGRSTRNEDDEVDVAYDEGALEDMFQEQLRALADIAETIILVTNGAARLVSLSLQPIAEKVVFARSATPSSSSTIRIEVYRLAEGKVLLVEIAQVPPSCELLLARSLLPEASSGSAVPKQVLIFGALSESTVLRTREAGTGSTKTRFIRTNKNESACGDNLLSQLESTSTKLEPGCLIAGMAAAMIAACEARRISCFAQLVLRKASLSVATYMALEASVVSLERFLQLGIAVPPREALQLLVKRDPFFSTTENLFT